MPQEPADRIALIGGSDYDAVNIEDQLNQENGNE